MYLILAVLLCSLYGFYIGRKKSLSLVKKEDIKNLNSKPNYHGYYIFFLVFNPINYNLYYIFYIWKYFNKINCIKFSPKY